jgi:hypothetical protein
MGQPRAQLSKYAMGRDQVPLKNDPTPTFFLPRKAIRRLQPPPDIVSHPRPSIPTLVAAPNRPEHETPADSRRLLPRPIPTFE